MIKKLKNKLLILSSLLIMVLPGAFPALAAASSTNCNTSSATGTLNPSETNTCLCSGSNIDLSGSTPCPDTSGTGLNSVIKTVINILSVLVGIVAVIMIIIGGFRYVTSGGKQESVTGAKNTILYAVIGLVIVALAQIIVHFVLNNTTSVSAG